MSCVIKLLLLLQPTLLFFFSNALWCVSVGIYTKILVVWFEPPECIRYIAIYFSPAERVRYMACRLTSDISKKDVHHWKAGAHSFLLFHCPSDIQVEFTSRPVPQWLQSRPKLEVCSLWWRWFGWTCGKDWCQHKMPGPWLRIVDCGRGVLLMTKVKKSKLACYSGVVHIKIEQKC